MVTIALFATKCQSIDAKSIFIKDTVAEKNIIPGNLSINKGNAYNDIFLDSVKLENFIRQGNLGDTIPKPFAIFIMFEI